MVRASACRAESCGFESRRLRLLVVGSVKTAKHLVGKSHIDNIMKMLVYGHARSGTTILTCILHSHPDVHKSYFEPFSNNADSGLWKIKKDPIQLIQSLKAIYEKVDIVKSLCGEVPEEHLKIYFEVPDKIILTRRRNLLRAAVSSALARQTQIWQKRKAGDDYGENFQPLEFGLIRWLLEFYHNITDYSIRQMNKNGIEFTELWYEDFFLSKDKEERLNWLFGEMGLRVPHKLDHYLNLMNNNRLNSERTYLKIPNVYDIEREFGSDEKGWLLKEGLMI